MSSFQSPPLARPSSLANQQGFIGERPAFSSYEENNLLACALDEIACGVIIVDAQARLHHANLAGQAVLQRGSVIATQGALIGAVHSADAGKPQDAIAKAIQGKRSMLTLGVQAQATVAVVPLDRHAERPTDQTSRVSAAPTAASIPRAALIFSRSGMCEALMMSFFARAYSLTRSEEQILSLLCVGHTAPEMAKQLRVGEATVRTHIRSICQKTHSNGIRDVTKRLALLPPLMSAVMPSAFA